MHPNVQRVQAALSQRGVAAQVEELSESTRTAAEAAAAIGTTIGQIAKSLIFTTEDGEPVLVIASGSNRVCVDKLSRLLGRPVAPATAKMVREITGFPVGGVPPVGHQRAMPTYVDEDLLQYQEIWAAGGTPQAIFPITPPQLVEITQGQVADLREE
ncbi:MAG TPA: YbaK/EbsC family protein [Sphingobacteriaceae bacterium]|nr:YbaK/EbsC family protein [Sphingobacteriaceae bacterium]